MDQGWSYSFVTNSMCYECTDNSWLWLCSGKIGFSCLNICGDSPAGCISWNRIMADGLFIIVCSHHGFILAKTIVCLYCGTTQNLFLCVVREVSSLIVWWLLFWYHLVFIEGGFFPSWYVHCLVYTCVSHVAKAMERGIVMFLFVCERLIL